MMAHNSIDLPDILSRLDPKASRVERHLWLIRLMGWVRGDRQSVDSVLNRIRHLLDVIEAKPAYVEAWRAWWRAFMEGVDMTALFADHGFAPRLSFVSEFSRRLRRKLFPATPDTADMSELFDFLFVDDFDIEWLRALDDEILDRFQATFLSADVPSPIENHTGGIQPQNTAVDVVQPLSSGQRLLIDALTYSVSQVSATGFASEIRNRMSHVAQEERPFHALPLDFERFRVWVEGAGVRSEAAMQSAEVFRQKLNACRYAAFSVYAHLDEHGVSVNIVFRLHQLRERVMRINTLLDCLQSERPAKEIVRFFIHLIHVSKDASSLRAFLSRSAYMTAAKVAERSAETGDHYIARDREEYRLMLRQSLGGGAIVALTTWMKYLILEYHLPDFWAGMAASLNYAASFVFIMLMHWTLATKQPAMTAPLMAAKLKDWGEGHGVDGFVTETILLLRTQGLAIIGNIGMVVPAVLVLCFILDRLGMPMLDVAHAEHSLHDVSLSWLTALFAAFTGVLLFVSSIIAGWVENWFVLHRLDSAIRYNPKLTGFLGEARAARWAAWSRRNISGLAANISLGLLLGVAPAILGFFGIGLQVRHVTLSSGQVAASIYTLGPQALLSADFLWVLAGLFMIGCFNVGVSFYLAFRVALRANNISGVDRRLIQSAVFKAWKRSPLDFFLPRYPSFSSAPSPEAPQAGADTQKEERP